MYCFNLPCQNKLCSHFTHFLKNPPGQAVPFTTPSNPKYQLVKQLRFMSFSNCVCVLWVTWAPALYYCLPRILPKRATECFASAVECYGLDVRNAIHNPVSNHKSFGFASSVVAHKVQTYHLRGIGQFLFSACFVSAPFVLQIMFKMLNSVEKLVEEFKLYSGYQQDYLPYLFFLFPCQVQ